MGVACSKLAVASVTSVTFLVPAIWSVHEEVANRELAEATSEVEECSAGGVHSIQDASKITCPFLRTFVATGNLPVKASYTKEELMELTINAGQGRLSRKDARAHVKSNFKNIPSGKIDIFCMEGSPPEHKRSTGYSDCDTKFFKCRRDENKTQMCRTLTEDCRKPNKVEAEHFFAMVDANSDGWMTVEELAGVDERVDFNDANPTGEGTIEDSHIVLINVFGELEFRDRISKGSFMLVAVESKFPPHYTFKPANLILNFFEAGSGNALNEAHLMYKDRAGKVANAIPQGRRRNNYIGFDGVNLRLTSSSSGIHILHDQKLNFGADRSFTVAGWVKPESLAYPASPFVMKKGHGMYVPAGNRFWSPGWEIGHGFRDQGITFTARDSFSTTANGKRCTGNLDFDHNKTWSSMLNQWTHIAVVVNRKVNEAILYLNGKSQEKSVSLVNCSGSWDNTHSIELFYAYGWLTVGSVRSYKILDGTARDSQILAEVQDEKAV
eukprot:gnl/MRDRNA2_/MRDRNA2_92350_c0_seq1.p1 gnl/MRDRNA2_/MRDRNA2_92350_c0~~gnl/MRDRNA2_/MRDRNA2_92350_c0_seq1.p1  ORF type:complete len:516 (-),score=82.12 gnl/MRDRNA2_/MRDRNA2_92350_c0_seq1:351-1838(-)